MNTVEIKQNFHTLIDQIDNECLLVNFYELMKKRSSAREGRPARKCVPWHESLCAMGRQLTIAGNALSVRFPNLPACVFQQVRRFGGRRNTNRLGTK